MSSLLPNAKTLEKNDPDSSYWRHWKRSGFLEIAPGQGTPGRSWLIVRAADKRREEHVCLIVPRRDARPVEESVECLGKYLVRMDIQPTAKFAYAMYDHCPYAWRRWGRIRDFMKGILASGQPVCEYRPGEGQQVFNVEQRHGTATVENIGAFFTGYHVGLNSWPDTARLCRWLVRHEFTDPETLAECIVPAFVRGVIEGTIPRRVSFRSFLSGFDIRIKMHGQK